jgi:competence CoiA-like predicted nuclease
MENLSDTKKHARIQKEIVSACQDLGIEAIQEFGGRGWRADVFVPNNGKPIAFEIQLSPQSLKRTLNRQSKYIRDGIIGCWLFENPIAKLNEERPDLPLFYVEDRKDSTLQVNLGDRRKLDLHLFLENFISNNIQFKSVAKTNTKQLVNLVFYKMECWKCHEMNHLFYVDTPFYSACNAQIKPEETLWGSDSMEYRPEIIELAQKFIDSRRDINIKLGQIKKRLSKTVEDYYTSFGCIKCDSIFGDWYVMEAKLDIMYEPKELTFQGEIELNESIVLPIPHWCFPEDKQFCTNK